MDKKVVAIIFGGQSSEHEVSKSSAQTIISALSEDSYFVLPIYITKDGKWFLYDGPHENIPHLNWEKLATPVVLSPSADHRGILRLVGNKFKLIPIDVAFAILHGKNGEDGSIQGLFQLANIPYVGSGVLSSAVCMDKTITKLIAQKHNIDIAEYLIFSKQDYEKDTEEILKKVRYKIGYPCFIKPANTGSSVGISKAKSKDEVVLGITDALTYDDKIIVEKGVFGRELECSVLGNHTPKASNVGEVTYTDQFYSYDAKYNNSDSKTIVPASIPDDVSEKIRQLSIDVFKACGCKGLARVDFFLEAKTNKVIFNEINTLPGFTSISMYPMLWKSLGMSIEGLVQELISLASL